MRQRLGCDGVGLWPVRWRALVQRKHPCLYMNALRSSLLRLARVVFELGSAAITPDRLFLGMAKTISAALA